MAPSELIIFKCYRLNAEFRAQERRGGKIGLRRDCTLKPSISSSSFSSRSLSSAFRSATLSGSSSCASSPLTSSTALSASSFSTCCSLSRRSCPTIHPNVQRFVVVQPDPITRKQAREICTPRTRGQIRTTTKSGKRHLNLSKGVHGLSPSVHLLSECPPPFFLPLMLEQLLLALLLQKWNSARRNKVRASAMLLPVCLLCPGPNCRRA